MLLQKPDINYPILQRDIDFIFPQDFKGCTDKGNLIFKTK